MTRKKSPVVKSKKTSIGSFKQKKGKKGEHQKGPRRKKVKDKYEEECDFDEVLTHSCNIFRI